SRAPARRDREPRRHAGSRRANHGVPPRRQRRARPGVPPVSEDALAIAAAVREGRIAARDVAAAALERIRLGDPAINAFTAVIAAAALAEAARVDERVAAGVDPGPLAGVPFAVKNLLDVAGLVTLAGSRIHAERPPAAQDARAVALLRRAGAVPVGA